MLKLHCCNIAMFEVRIVRQRSARGTCGRLQALRRRFSMAVSDRHLKVFVGPPPLSSASAERHPAALSIAQNRIKSVWVRGRLLRIVVDDGNALT